MKSTDDAASIRSYAVRAAGRLRVLDSLPSLVPLLEAHDGTIRSEAAESIGLISNFDVGQAAHECGLARSSTEPDRDAMWTETTRPARAHAVGRRAYEALWQKLGKSPREVWLAEGFRTTGFRVHGLDKTSVWELVRASAVDGFVGLNARSVLARIANEPEVPWATPPAEACSYYLDYFRVRARKFGLGEPPPTVRAACPSSKGT